MSSSSGAVPEQEDEDAEAERISLRLPVAIGIFVVFLIITDLVWGARNRHVASDQMQRGIDTWQVHLDVSKTMLEQCGQLASMASFAPQQVQVAIEGSCMYLHPKGQIAINMFERSEKHYDIATKSVERYLAILGQGAAVAAITVTLCNKRTRDMLPWVLRNPFGLDK